MDRNFVKNFVAMLIVLVASSATGEPAAIGLGEEPRPQEAVPDTNRIEQKGLVVEFSAAPAGTRPGATLTEGDSAEIRFRISDARSGQPMKGLKPGSWLDLGHGPTEGRHSASCKLKIATYLKGVAGVRPMIDLSSYYILAFNRDASISVIDPLVGLAGRTNLLATIPLDDAPGDWVKTRDGKRLYVTLPNAGKIAVIDTDSFTVVDHVDAGTKPMRIVLDADDRNLWIGNDGDVNETGGVTVVDANSLTVVAHISTGRGHHELAFSHDDRFAFISNREKGDVSVIDAATLTKHMNIATGSTPIALTYSRIAQTLYVADGADGTVTVIQGAQPHIVSVIHTRPGLGPIRVTPDGRWALALNVKENLVDVIDVVTNRLVQSIPVGARPYQIGFSDAFAYIRSLDSEMVGMIALSRLGKEEASRISLFPAGAKTPATVDNLGVGASIARAVGEAAVVVASPADNLVYYYMEGMLAPSGNFRNPGHEVGAVDVLDRSLRETEPGVYSARVVVPASGNYDVAFLLGVPSINECFHVAVAPDASRPKTSPPATVSYLEAPKRVTVEKTIPWRFRLEDPQSGKPRSGLTDVRVLTYAAPGLRRTETRSREVEPGVYEAELQPGRAGAYYVFVGVPSLNMKYGDLSYRNLLVIQ